VAGVAGAKEADAKVTMADKIVVDLAARVDRVVDNLVDQAADRVDQAAADREDLEGAEEETMALEAEKMVEAGAEAEAAAAL